MATTSRLLFPNTLRPLDNLPNAKKPTGWSAIFWRFTRSAYSSTSPRLKAVAVRLVVRLTSLSDCTSLAPEYKGRLEPVHRASRLFLRLAVQGRLGQGEDNERFASYGADVVVQTNNLYARDVLDQRLQ